MDLRIQEVSELLGISERMVGRLLSEGKIPAYRLNKEYRFSRSEIESWMIDQNSSHTRYDANSDIALEDKIADKINVNSLQYSFYRAIHRGGVYHDVHGNNKEEVIRESVKAIAKNLRLDAEVITELILDREKLAPTALGHGVAVPHARDFLLQRPFDVVSVVFLQKPIDFGALDEKLVHTLFFIFASTDKTHLHLLSKIAHLSCNTESIEIMQSRLNRLEFLNYIKQWESTINS